jgi:hypothetical protein
MKKNIGSADRIIRVVLALAIGILIATNVLTGTLGIILGVVAVVLLLTSGMSLCPIYLALGISTMKKVEPVKL